MSRPSPFYVRTGGFVQLNVSYLAYLLNICHLIVDGFFKHLIIYVCLTSRIREPNMTILKYDCFLKTD